MNSSTNAMRTFSLTLLIPAAVFAFTTRAAALSITHEVNAEYLQTHPTELSVEIVRRENGLIDFTFVRNLAQEKYFVARLVIRQGEKTIAETSTPLFGRPNKNKFHVTVSADHLAGSEFELGESFFAKSGDSFVPLPGTVDYHFKLSELVPLAQPKREPGK
jgi:hypothetical protein